MTDKQATKGLYNKIASTWAEKSWVKSDEFAQQFRLFVGVKDESALEVGIGSGDAALAVGLKKGDWN